MLRKLTPSLLLALVCFVAVSAQNRVKIIGIAERGGQTVSTSGVISTTKVMRTYPGATITVFDHGTTNLSSLCSDNLNPCTTAANPQTASLTDASFGFYVVSGEYDIRVSGSAVGIPLPFTISDINTGLSASSTVSGGNVTRIAKVVLTSTYTVLSSDAGKLLVFNNTGTVAVSLAQAGTSFASSGFWFDASVIGGGTASITPSGSLINGAPTLGIPSGSGASGITNDGTNWFAVQGGSTSPSPATTIINPDDYGAIHDGSSHLLSSRYGTLAQAQAAFNGAYGFVTSLSQQIDYAAVKAASNVAFGPDGTAGAYITINKDSTTTIIVDPGATYSVNSLVGQTLFLRYYNGFVAQEPIASNTATTITLSIALPFDFHCSGEICLSTCAAPPQTFDCIAYAIGAAGEHGLTNARLNKPLFLPGGIYELGSDEWLIRNASGIWIYGTGRTSTILEGSGIVFGTDGLWYSRIQGIGFHRTASSAGPVVDIDGNVPGHPYTTRSVQQNTFSDLQISGTSGTAAGTIGVAQCRLGGSSAQCENLWVNPQIQTVATAFYNNGFNALANMILRGDMQDYITGVSSIAGWVNVSGTSFESGHPYEQATQGGFAISIGSAGVGEPMVFDGIRTEDLQFYKGSSNQPGILIGVQQSFGPGFTQWSALGNYTLHQVITKTVVADANRTHAFYVSTAGTSGAVEPVWPATGAIADGSMVWTELPFFSVDTTSISGGQQPRTISILDSNFLGPVSIGGWNGSDLQVRSATTANFSHVLTDWQFPRSLDTIDATSNNVTFTLNAAPIGQMQILYRSDATGNIATVAGGTSTINGGASLTLPANGVVILLCSSVNEWKIVAKNFGLDAATLNNKTFEVPGTIGSTTPNTGSFTTLNSTGGALNGTMGTTTPTTIKGTTINATTGFQNNGLAQYFFVTTDFTTAANTNLQLITGLTWTVPANTAMNIPFQCYLAYSQATGTDVVSFGIQDVTIAPTNVFATGLMQTNTTVFSSANLPALTTSTATAIVTGTPSAITTIWKTDLAGFVEHPSNTSSSAIQIMVKTNTAADAVTIKRGSYCRIN